jgi:hypothetical protein
LPHDLAQQLHLHPAGDEAYGVWRQFLVAHQADTPGLLLMQGRILHLR